MFFKIGALKTLANFTEKKPVLEYPFNKVPALKAYNFLLKRGYSTDVFV